MRRRFKAARQRRSRSLALSGGGRGTGKNSYWHSWFIRRETAQGFQQRALSISRTLTRKVRTPPSPCASAVRCHRRHGSSGDRWASTRSRSDLSISHLSSSLIGSSSSYSPSRPLSASAPGVADADARRQGAAPSAGMTCGRRRSAAPNAAPRLLSPKQFKPKRKQPPASKRLARLTSPAKESSGGHTFGMYILHGPGPSATALPPCRLFTPEPICEAECCDRSPRAVACAPVDSSSLTTGQFDALLFRIGTTSDYLTRLLRRMEALSFPRDDAMWVATVRANDAIGALRLVVADLEQRAKLPRWAGGQAPVEHKPRSGRARRE
jgi:hypothetical protein